MAEKFNVVPVSSTKNLIKVNILYGVFSYLLQPWQVLPHEAML